MKSVPTHIVIKLQAWIEMVGTCGLNSISEVPGYRNEALQGKRKGQYSIRLNKAYRAIYKIDRLNNIQLIEIMRVTKHEY